jgi:sec-independent protein translocase protein TatA
MKGVTDEVNKPADAHTVTPKPEETTK